MKKTRRATINRIARLLPAFFLLILCVSCGGPEVSTNSYVAGGLEGLAPPEPGDDIDTACSYFYFLWARHAELNGLDDEAQEAYEKAIVCDGSDEYPVRRLAALLLKMGKREQAVSLMKKLLATHPDDVRTKIYMADLYASIAYDGGRDADEFKQAAAIYRQILSREPGRRAVMLKLGKLYMRHAEYAKARTILKKLVNHNSTAGTGQTNVAGWYYLARLYRQAGDYRRAAAAYEKVLELNWSVPMALEAAEFYERRQENRQAIVIYKKILADDGEDEVVTGRLVRIYLQNNEADKAVALLRGLRDKTTDSLKIDFTLGRIYLDQHEYDKAVTLFKEMQSQNPGVGEIRSLLALSYYESGAKAKARKILLDTGPADDGYADAVLMLVRIYADDKDYPAAVDLLRGAIAHDRSRPAVRESGSGISADGLKFYFALAAIYEENKELAKAGKVFQQVIKRSASAKSYLQYGMFLDRIKRPVKALRMMEKALVMEPDNIMALNYVGYTWADQGVKLEQALAYIKKAVASRPDDGFIRDSLGWVYFRLGEMKQAVAEFKRALRDEPDDPTIHEHAGDVYNAIHESEAALDNYQQALSLFDKETDQRRLRDKIQQLQQKMRQDTGSNAR